MKRMLNLLVLAMVALLVAAPVVVAQESGTPEKPAMSDSAKAPVKKHTKKMKAKKAKKAKGEKKAEKEKKGEETPPAQPENK